MVFGIMRLVIYSLWFGALGLEVDGLENGF